MVIGIIGSGASGMAAALAAAENPGNQVILLERQARVGRKLQATGNGRCNLSNIHALEGHYHGEDPRFSLPALRAFSPEAALQWFQDLGLYTVTEDSGKVYPYSDQANSVVDVLRFALDKPNIRLETGCEVSKVKKTEQGFYIASAENSWNVDRLVIACGGLAGSKLGGTMSGYQLLRSFGHSCTRLRPALVQVKTDWPGITALKGVRANCAVTVYRDEEAFAASCGEMQFTEQGVSGPVMFEISRDVCFKKGRWKCVLDFLPDLTHEQILSFLRRKQGMNLNAEDLFTGIIHNRLGKVIVKEAGISGYVPLGQLEGWELSKAASLAKAFPISLTEPLGMDAAQVTAGGILTAEFDPETMESRKVPGLYACGEVLDIDGDCGGYNLQWAWSSGRMAGLSAGKDRQ